MIKYFFKVALTFVNCLQMLPITFRQTSQECNLNVFCWLSIVSRFLVISYKTNKYDSGKWFFITKINNNDIIWSMFYGTLICHHHQHLSVNKLQKWLELNRNSKLDIIFLGRELKLRCKADKMGKFQGVQVRTLCRQN